jgi:hypothetical protein
MPNTRKLPAFRAVLDLPLGAGNTEFPPQLTREQQEELLEIAEGLQRENEQLRRESGKYPLHDEETDQDGIYYRPIRSRQDNLYTPACMQWFDEFDYDQSRFYGKEKYREEADCQKVCDELNSPRIIIQHLIHQH